MLQDLYMAARRLRSQALVTVTSAGVIAVGIGTATALFTITDGLLFRPLPFAHQERLVAISAPFEPHRRLRPGERAVVREQLEQSRLLEDHAYVSPGLLFEEGASVADVGLVQMDVSSNLFQMLGIRPILGALPEGESEATVTPPSIVVGYELWRARFGADERLVGQVVSIDDRPFRIVGVMPRGFEFPFGANLWRVRQLRSGSALPSYGRLASGVTIEQFRGQFPQLTIESLRNAIRPDGAFALAYLLGATALVLIVAWVQVAGLQVSRDASRVGSIGIRLALGASRFRIVREFIAEGVVLALLALGVAWLLAPAMTAGVLRLLPPDMTRGQTLGADWRSLVFACGVSAVGVVLFALFPARMIVGSTPLAALQARGARGMARSAGRIRAMMVVGQLGVTSLLLYLTGLAFHSFWQIVSVDPGFRAHNVMVVTVPASRVSDNASSGQQLVSDALDAIGRLPEVTSAAAALTYPSQRGAMRGTLQIPSVPDFEPTSVRVNYVTPGFFRTLAVPVLEGRDLNQADGTSPEPGAVVNGAFAARLRPYGHILGQIVQVTSLRARIIGVVADSMGERLDRPPEPQIFFPQERGITPVILVRVAHDRPDVAASIISIVERFWGRAPNRPIVRLEDELSRSTTEYRGRSILLGALAVVAIVLAVAGVLGALTYATEQQAREIAIHLALGAQPSVIRRRVVRWAMVATGAGLVAGVGSGILAGSWASRLWFGVRPLDATTITAVTVLLAATGFVSAYVPARRAARTDPALALREE